MIDFLYKRTDFTIVSSAANYKSTLLGRTVRLTKFCGAILISCSDRRGARGYAIGICERKLKYFEKTKTVACGDLEMALLILLEPD